MKIPNIINIKGIIKEINTTVENILENNKDKFELKNRLQQLVYLLDSGSEHWLPANIRPLSLLLMLVVYVAFSILDGNVLEIKEIYITMLGKILWTMLGFYFGLRFLEKKFKSKK